MNFILFAALGLMAFGAMGWYLDGDKKGYSPYRGLFFMACGLLVGHLIARGILTLL